MMTEGTFKATVVGASVGESPEKKTPFLAIEFEVPTGESIEYIGYLTEATKERTLGNLIACGFKGNKLADLADDRKSLADLFDIVEGISIVIEHEEYETSDGEKKQRPRIKWINVGSGGMTKFDHKQALAAFKSFTFDGDIARIKKEGPTKKEKKPKDPTAPATSKEQAAADGVDYTSDDIPF